MWLDYILDYWQAQIVANDQAASKGSSGVTWMSHLWFEKELGKWDWLRTKSVVDLWAPLYTLYKCLILIDNDYTFYIVYIENKKMNEYGHNGKRRV